MGFFKARPPQQTVMGNTAADVNKARESAGLPKVKAPDVPAKPTGRAAKGTDAGRAIVSAAIERASTDNRAAKRRLW